MMVYEPIFFLRGPSDKVPEDGSTDGFRNAVKSKINPITGLDRP